MSDLRDQEHIDAVRERLYARGSAGNIAERHSLTDRHVDVARNWNTPSNPEATPNLVQVETANTEAQSELPTKRSQVRKYVLLGSLGIFAVVALFSSLYMLMGGSAISSDNISINISGPSTLAGGDTVSLQFGVTNQNTVAIETATLVIRYPAGTRSVVEPIENLFEQRIPLQGLAPGEAKNIPVQVAVFGQENEEKQITATIEYRMVGSNGMFFKEAEPYRMQITSSPLVLEVTSVQKVASGQTMDITVRAKSNASAPLKNILVSAKYPNGFSFSESTPAPVFNENVWRIDELLPEQNVTITIKGVPSGQANERFVINLDAGPARPDNQFIVGSTLAIASFEYTIERPFIDVRVEINQSQDPVVVIEEGENGRAQIFVTNTLDETVYDMVVEVVPGGNILNESSLNTSSGFYDSNRGVVRFEPSNNPDFREVRPGQTRTLDFSVTPLAPKNAASFELLVNVYARRLAQSSAQEQLLGTVRAEARYTSIAQVATQMNLGTGVVPPKVGQATVYQANLVARAGVNDLTNTVVKTTLPVYVEWTNQYTGDGTVDYNPVTKEITWQAGNIETGRTKELVFSVSLLPSSSQVGITPVLVNQQTLTATDRFTNSELNAIGGQVTTELSTEYGFERGNGTIQP